MSLPQFPPHLRLTGAERARVIKEVAKLYNKGLSVRQIAARCGRSYGSIHRMLTQAEEVTLRGRGGNNAGLIRKELTLEAARQRRQRRKG